MNNYIALLWLLYAMLVGLALGQTGDLSAQCRLAVSPDGKLICKVNPGDAIIEQLGYHSPVLLANNVPTEMFSRNVITDVRIKSSSFSGFGENLFTGFTGMKGFRLQKSMVGEIPESLFSYSKSLVLIQISGTDIRELHSQTFQGLNQLTTLEISGNHNLSRIPNNVFQGLSKLTSLSLFQNSLTTLEPETFSTLHNLESLQLHKNHIHSLPAGVFTSNIKLMGLTLHHNQLTAISEEWFTTTKHIEHLNLSRNRITEVPANAFRNLEALKKLNLMMNQITKVSENAFVGLSKVHNLALGHNKIAELPAKLFEGKTHPRHLTLNNNELTRVQSDLFNGLSNMDYLALDGNKIEDIEQGALQDCNGLKTLKLNSNKLRQIDSSFIQGLVNLQALHLEHNAITLLAEDCFSLHRTHLHKIFLNNNRLSVIPFGAFYELPHLKRVMLNNNKLTAIMPNAFPAARLEFVDLTANMFTDSVEEIIAKIPNVESVALDDAAYHGDVIEVGSRTFSRHDGFWSNTEYF